jgi:GT2 family glycosyltransferase
MKRQASDWAALPDDASARSEVTTSSRSSQPRRPEATLDPRSPPYVATIVLNWNRWTETLSCLDALSRLTQPQGVLVVDNGSTDGSEDEIRQRRPGVRLLQTGANLGYAGGNNRGIREALADGATFVWILNNDARPHPDALSALLRTMLREPRVGILASVVRPRGVATALSGSKHLVCEGCDEEFHEADMVMGCSLFFRSEVLRDVGLFDERYFHYAEEQDLAMRVREAGWGLGLSCTSVVDHARGASLPGWAPQASYYKLRNLLLFEQRFFQRATVAFLLQHRRRLRAHLALRTSVRERDLRRVVAVTLAIADAVRGRGGRRDLGDRYQRVQRP